MLGSYVCRQCRARLTRRVAPVRNPQWQPRATFLSLRNQKTPDGAEPTQDEAQNLREAIPPEDTSRNGPRIQYAPTGPGLEPRSPEHGPRGPYSRHVRDDTRGGTPSVAAYGNGPIQADVEHSEGLSDKAGRSYARQLHDRLSSGRVAEAWDFFEKTYTSKDCKALTEPAFLDMELLGQGKIFLRLLESVSIAFCKGNMNLAITPTAVLFRYEQLGIARPEFWDGQAIAYLTYQAIRATNTSTKTPLRDLPSILFELLSVWRLFFQCKGSKGDALETISTEWQLPAVESLPDMHESKDFSMRLQEFHPKYVGNSTLGFCAVYLYSISDALNSVKSLQQQAAPLLRFLERLLAGAHVGSVYNHTNRSKAFKALPEQVRQQIVKEINTAPQRAMVMIGSTGETLTDASGDAAANLEAFHLKRIARATESRVSPAILDTLWKELGRDYTAKGEHSTIPPRIYNALLSGYLMLHTSQRSVEVWNHMIASGVQPDVQSWVALLEGCAKAKDLDGFNAMWTRMLNTGLEPDNHAWTTRVNGLISLRQVNLGLAALDEMGKRWLSADTVINTPQTHGKNRKGAKNLPASSKAVNNCTKPSTEVINGAISALVQIRPESMRHDKRIEHVQKILGWAGNFEIRPDARTYNSLIQLYLRAGDYKTAFKVLRQMEVDGLQSDIATYTMLLGAAFNNQKFDNLPGTVQTERIISMFNDLESSGLKLNDYIYSMAIDRMLKQYSNHDAVRALIDHMQSRKLVPSAHVYTSLVTHYFQQNPPALTAVDNVVDQVFTNHRVPNDRILFDRLLEGYAQHGEVGKMMSVLTRMSKHGKLPGWSALTAVVRALFMDGDVERARAVVSDVERGEGVAQGGIMGLAQGEKVFFAMARDFGIGSQEEKGMGDLWRDDRAMRASADQTVLGQQLRDQEIQHMTRNEEAQEEATAQASGARNPPARYYADAHEDIAYERDPGSLVKDGKKEEENVHGFLTHEQEPGSNRTQKL